ncbi:5-carboxymethyl-2-hydroxymuconate Delta-isomerase [Parazoarcus communis]|uniref:5-carboxymethyl-2-hydroxymuconate isomerase n=1 Tax=Parazoarcus communis SWub3 = DSM 12120 TaxID=1121029 RepID=A0A323US55_9RHOO|nr:5-carboxymethyl-2-hydroxymuconate Delta-isomerase [Parazoarcus communis]NMG71095.1 5-carboxymethyl-2-hydroxymuconate isomerase [Parazoarcus communis SWub3 = DSM 12120]PZA15207.1 5-carboxymethyl-2-hydroxymuconate isomerase [Azoarcus communis] [Parazoarcus communis SWub3 = DSM 12120]
MAHLIFEYTRNLGPAADIPGLLRKANQVMIAQEVFPIGGIRSRAIELVDYCVADGSADDAFVHATVKIGAGRSTEARQKTGDDLFAMMKTHFAALYANRTLALSLELIEFSEAGTWKHNNIHARYRQG